LLAFAGLLFVPVAAQAQSAGWQPLAPAFGTGSAVCNTSRNLYSCLALRCGAGRGTEFAFFFNVGDYGTAPGANIGVDGKPVAGVPFTAIDPTKELVAPYNPVVHASLIAALKSGSVLEFDIGHRHRFSLKGSSAAIERTLAACVAETGTGQVAAREGAVSADEMRAKVAGIIRSYQPSGEALDPETLAPAVGIIPTPQFGSADLVDVKLEPNPDAAFGAINPSSLDRHPGRRFVASPAHAQALVLYDATAFGTEPAKARVDELFLALDEALAEASAAGGPALAAVLELAALSRNRQYGPFAEHHPGAAAVADLWRQTATEFYKAARGSPFDPDLADHLGFALIREAQARTRGDANAVCSGRPGDDAISGIWLEAVGVDLALRKPRLPVLAWLREAALCTGDAGQRLAIMKERARLAGTLGNRAGVDAVFADLGLTAMVAGDADLARQAYRRAFAAHRAGNPRDEAELEFLVDLPPESRAPTHIAALRQLALDPELDYVLARRLANYIAEWDLDSTVGQGFALALVIELEEARRVELSDDFHGYLLTLYGGGFDKRPSNRNLLMSIYAQQMLDIERYDLAEGLLRRALARAGQDDPANGAVILIQLARLEDERGNLAQGLFQARAALREIRAGGIELADYELEPLRAILTRAEQEQGRRDRAARQIASDLARELPEACVLGGNAYGLTSAFPIARLLADADLADAFLREAAAADYARCVGENLVRLPGVESPFGDSFPTDAVAHGLYILGRMGERESAERILAFLFEEKNWLFRQDDDELLSRIPGFRPGDARATRISVAREFSQNAVIDLYGQAIKGLRWAGEAEWVEPWLEGIPRAFSTDYVVTRNANQSGVGLETHLLGLELLSIGRTDLAREIYEIVLANPSTGQFDADGCLMVSGCEFHAVMAEAFGDREGAREYLEKIPGRFTVENSGANVSTDESDALTELAIETGLLHEQAGRHRLALTYFETAQSGYEYMTGMRDPLANLSDIQILAATARAKHRLGETEAAHELAGTAIDPARRRLERGVGGADELVRWSFRLRDVFETWLDTAPADSDGVMTADEDAFFALQYLQATRTASTIAKIAERAADEDSGSARRRQDIEVELASLYERLIPTSGRDARTIIADIDRLEGEAAALAPAQDQVAGNDPGLRFLSLAALQAGLARKEAMLLALNGREHAYAWLIEAGRSRLLRLKQKPAEIDGLVRGLRAEVQRYLDTPVADQEATLWPLEPFHAPYAALLTPFADMTTGIDRLYFVPTGAFDSLPLAALLEQVPPKPEMTASEIREARLPWLVRRMAVNVLPSAQSLDALRKLPAIAASKRPFLGIADPDFGDGLRIGAGEARALEDLVVPVAALPDTADEVERIAAILSADPARDLLLAGSASEASIRNADLSSYRIVNFATHGVLAGEVRGVDEPALLLSVPANSEPGNDGILRASEIAALKVDAELVILSACNTAGSDGTPGAEGLSGLANAFFFAGARNLVVTHWEIPSAPAVEIATGMIEADANSGGASDWANALRASAVAMIDGKGPPEFAHPAAWGAHMLVGAAR